MRAVLAFDEVVLRDVEELQRQVAEIVEFVARQNAYLVRRLGRQRIPRLYDSGVLYRVDPWDPSFQHFADALTVLRRGFGDCKSLVPWLLCDLREQYPREHFAVHVYPRRAGRDGLHDAVRANASLDLHLQVRKPNGDIEDPSRYLRQ